MKIFCATSFGKEGLELYGKTMVSSFIKHWPKDIILRVYLDDIEDQHKLEKAENVEFVHLNDPNLLAFKQRNNNDSKKHGYNTWEAKPSKDKFNKNNEGSWKFQFDSIRFCHKVFAINHCARSGCDIAIWLDGDTKTFADIPLDVILSWIPKRKFAGFLDRSSYTETGFHIFDMTHPIAIDFFNTWIQYYIDDSIYNLPAWTDCHTYDAARIKFDQSFWHNLSPTQKNYGASHVFINGELGTYMDHMKGKRKILGKSNKGDLRTPRTEEYWKNL
jgi:hypothetical protein